MSDLLIALVGHPFPRVKSQDRAMGEADLDTVRVEAEIRG